MGFYDYRCMATGVSLKGVDAALVLLAPSGNALAPMVLAVTGNYNRLGSIDFVDEDTNTELLLRFFLDKLVAGELVTYHDEEAKGFDSIETLLQQIERGVTGVCNISTLNGQPLLYALICRTVWDSVARAGTSPFPAEETLLRELFPMGHVAREIYKECLPEVSRPLKELAAVSRFLAEHRIAWKPPDDAQQHYSGDMQAFLVEAKQAFSKVPAVLRAYGLTRKRWPTCWRSRDPS